MPESYQVTPKVEVTNQHEVDNGIHARRFWALRLYFPNGKYLTIPTYSEWKTEEEALAQARAFLWVATGNGSI